MKELDEVVIPAEIASENGVVEHGTIVWYVRGAHYATVECAVLSNNPQEIETKLIDIDIGRLMLNK